MVTRIAPSALPSPPVRRALPLALSLIWACSPSGPSPAGDRGEETEGGPPPISLPLELPPEGRELLGDSALVLAIFQAEDARPGGSAGLGPLREGLEADNPAVRRLAARGIGRLERQELAAELLPLLADPDPLVRKEVATALPQALGGGGGEALAELREALTSALQREADPAVRGLLLQGLGRLPHPQVQQLRATEALFLHALGQGAGGTPPAPEVLLGTARGSLHLYRGVAGRLPPDPALPAALAELSLRPTYSVADASGEDSDGDGNPPRPLDPRYRGALAAARLAAGPGGLEFLAGLLEDGAGEVRRWGGVGLATLPVGVPPTADGAEGDGAAQGDGDVRGGVRENSLDGLIRLALSDPHPPVRVEGVRAWGRHLQGELGCAPLEEAASDPDPHVALTALELLGAGCLPGEGEGVSALLRATAASLPAVDGPGWHAPTRALLSLARIAPEDAASLLPRFARAGSPFIRMWAARAAGILEDRDTLRRLAGDSHDIVREAAIGALAPLEGRAADPILIAQLQRRDPQLLRTAARLLEGTPAQGPAIPALLAALARLTREGGETSRDARVAILNRLEPLGTLWQADQLEPYLRDFDPVVAARAAAALEVWTGSPHTPRPTPPPRLPFPSFQELLALEEARIVIQMEELGEIVLELLPFQAPTNSYRFARLAAQGYFNDLTLHRVVPNFVLQGGSPGANEYAGDGPFTRDEVGMMGHWRGTLGISTRGRDTGDAQLFLNLVDNLRLDHDYTIFAQVAEGLEVADRILEGARMLRVEVEGFPLPSPPEEEPGLVEP